MKKEWGCTLVSLTHLQLDYMNFQPNLRLIPVLILCAPEISAHQAISQQVLQVGAKLQSNEDYSYPTTKHNVQNYTQFIQQSGHTNHFINI